jgi:GTP-binding protein
MIDITEENLEKSYSQIKKELGSYSKKLLNKKEVIVLNKVDLLEKKNVEKIIKNFSKNKKCEVMTLSTFKKDSVSKIKAKLLNYVS